MSASKSRVDGFREVLVGLFVLAILGTTAAPALAKDHGDKPSKLWQQYPLNVGGPLKPSATPSQQASATPSPSSRAGGGSHVARDVRPHSASGGNGVLLALAGFALLALMGIGFAMTSRRRKPALPSAESSQVPFIARDRNSFETNQIGSSGEPDRMIEESDVTWAAAPERATTVQPGWRRNPLTVDRAEATFDLDRETGMVMAPERTNGNRNGLQRDQDTSSEYYEDQTGPRDREQGLVHLRDGRRLQGSLRTPSSDDEGLLILDVIAAFDSDGNLQPAVRADSFVLRSEIISIQRIDDS